MKAINTKEDDDEKRAIGAKEYPFAELTLKIWGPKGETTTSSLMSSFYPLSALEAELFLEYFEFALMTMRSARKVIFKLTRSKTKEGA